MEKKEEKVGFFRSLFGAKKSSCCCSFQLEEIDDQEQCNSEKVEDNGSEIDSELDCRTESDKE